MNVLRDALQLLAGAPWPFHAGLAAALAGVFALGVHRGRSARRRHAGT